MCSVWDACVYVCGVPLSTGMQSTRKSLRVLYHSQPSTLEKGFSLNLELCWHPGSPSNPRVFPSHRSGGTWLFFVGSGNLNSGPHGGTITILSLWAVSSASPIKPRGTLSVLTSLTFKFYFLCFILFLCWKVFWHLACLCTTCVPGACRGQRWV